MPEANAQLVDSHCHLNSAAFDGDRSEVLARAIQAGVTTVLDVGTDPDEWERSLRIAETDPRVRCVLGLHPNSASLWSAGLSDELRGLLLREVVVGIGETGLDYYRLGAPKERQMEVFAEHLAIARETGLPVVVHARDAYEDILKAIEGYGAGTTGVMHSFAGTPEQAARSVELGYYVSISGPVTYKNGGNVREAAAAVPVERLLVETDSPYLPPQPHRGERNEPSFVALTARAVAEVRGMSYEDLAAVTSRNAAELFGIGG